MQSKYRVAVIGHTGKGNYGHGLDTVWQRLPQCQIVGVADANEKGLAAAVDRLNAPKGYADYRQLLDETKPDIAAICPRWLDQHRDMVVAAAERGIHIYMEKPMCRSLAEADDMVEACTKADVKLAISHQTRYSPKLHVVRDLIYDGKIGEILELRGRGKEDRRGGGEDLWVLGSHIMNLMHHFGGNPNWCFAQVRQDNRPLQRSDIQPGSEGIGPLGGDALAAMYGMDDNVTGYFASQRNQGGGARFGLQVFGSKGIIEILTGYLPAVHLLPTPTWSPGRSNTDWIPVSSAGLGEPEPLKDGGLHAGNVLACQDLIDAIEQDRHPECNVFEARNTVEMIAAVFESHMQHAPVKIPLENRQNPLG